MSNFTNLVQSSQNVQQNAQQNAVATSSAVAQPPSVAHAQPPSVNRVMFISDTDMPNEFQNHVERYTSIIQLTDDMVTNRSLADIENNNYNKIWINIQSKVLASFISNNYDSIKKDYKIVCPHVNGKHQGWIRTLEQDLNLVKISIKKILNLNSLNETELFSQIYTLANKIPTANSSCNFFTKLASAITGMFASSQTNAQN
jgi:hypothetical protein